MKLYHPYIDTWSSAGCQCEEGYFWMDNACLIDCYIIEGATQRVNVETCECIEGRVWSQGKC